MVERAVFLAAVAAVGVGLGLWVHLGAGLIGAGALVVLDCWLPAPRRTGP
jgi:hypothetical protein